MASWLYSLLIGLGISSGGVAFIGVFVGLALLMIFFDERGCDLDKIYNLV